MSKTAILEFDGKKYEFPVIVGSENEAAIDIEKVNNINEFVDTELYEQNKDIYGLL